MIPPGPWTCPRRIGFLFPHACERLSPAGCPDCNNGSINDPYRERSDRGGYMNDDFDDYSSSETSGWPAFGGGDSGGAGASMDFTEADGASLTNPDRDFEDDLSAS